MCELCVDAVGEYPRCAIRRDEGVQYVLKMRTLRFDLFGRKVGQKPMVFDLG